jgi:hypothetical protein
MNEYWFEHLAKERIKAFQLEAESRRRSRIPKLHTPSFLQRCLQHFFRLVLKGDETHVKPVK